MTMAHDLYLEYVLDGDAPGRSRMRRTKTSVLVGDRVIGGEPGQLQDHNLSSGRHFFQSRLQQKIPRTSNLLIDDYRPQTYLNHQNYKVGFSNIIGIFFMTVQVHIHTQISRNVTWAICKK